MECGLIFEASMIMNQPAAGEQGLGKSDPGPAGSPSKSDYLFYYWGSKPKTAMPEGVAT